MRDLTSILLVALTLALAGCDGGGSTTDGDADSDTDVDVDGDSDSDATDSGPEHCDPPGSTRTIDCERCGSASQTCGEDGTWEEPGRCFEQGECEAGEVETDDTGPCGPTERLCRDDCTWSAWEPEPECDPGETRVEPNGCAEDWDRTDTCTESCTWEEGDCTGESPCGTRRMTPRLSEEICVPAGTFIRGDETFADARPVAEVTMSAYFIDRYPVTNERYRACYDAGVCPALNPDGEDYFLNPALGNRPVNFAFKETAETFCAWDGGRRLPTEAEWEMAARGPAPRDQPYVWGDTAERCDLVPTVECAGYEEPGWEAFPEDVDAWPGTASYYGVELMGAGGEEWTSDVYGPAYYSRPESLVDPTGPAPFPGCDYVSRGWRRDETPERRRIGYRRYWGYPTCVQCFIRCARDAEL